MPKQTIKRKIINIFTASILVSTAFSDEIKSTYENTYKEAYIKLSGLDKTTLENFINEDNFKIASDFVFDPTKQEVRKINQSDVHDTTGKLNYKEVRVPNYVDAIKYFKLSVENSMNPISAYAGSYIIQNFTSLQDEENLKLFKLFSDVLYKQKIKICNAYLNQGEIYENGYFVNKDEKKALRIYKEGLQDKNCESSWMKSVLTSKIIKLEKK